ncbi:hypothetical protein C3486_06370 [Streptomyces sp. Ru73]|uniref:hypothetical protein n=1 Tax=Streptomyces sp. Ru73 TaxID=2080748 RepID=UPI000CDD144F|nr:hypothetical protein [Streptomyces sp. Ru73]POX42096.1 hypothetical protein C3486_06370 [Streptomyces sp. Ru73]
MDPEIATLAGTAGTTLVTLMATDAWQSVRDGVVGLWRRARPDRADAVSAELEAAREDLLMARDSADEETEEELRRDWQGRIRRLLAARPDVADDLRALLAEVAPEEAAPAAPVITQHATASGSARVYQAGRDQHIHER